MGSTHGSPVSNDPPALPDEEFAKGQRRERKPLFDAHQLYDEDQQQSSRHERDVLSYKSVVKERAEAHEEISLSSGHGSLSDIHPPLCAEQPLMVPSKHYKLLSDEDMKLILQELDAEKQRNLQMSRWMKVHVEDTRTLLYALRCENFEAIIHKFQELHKYSMSLRNEVIEYQKKCRDLSCKLELLENVHSQKAMADSGSYQDSTATPPLLQIATDGVKGAISVCASALFSGFKKNANLVSIFEQLDLPIEQSGPANVKVALQALLCRILFKGFEDPFFCIRDSSILAPFEIPSKRKSQLFEAFRRCRDREARQLLDEDNDFKLFVDAKTYEVNAEIKVRLLSADNAQEFIDSELINNDDSNLCRQFLRLAKAVWVLHKLALAFEPGAEIFRVVQSSSFNDSFMEDIAHDEDAEEYESMARTEPQKQVTFMCVPGFTVRHTVIKSRVFCLQPVCCHLK